MPILIFFTGTSENKRYRFEDRLLDGILERLVCREVGIDVFCAREHRGVLSRTVVVKLCRMLAGSLHPLGFLFVEWQVCPASKMCFGQLRSFEHQLQRYEHAAAHRSAMHTRARSLLPNSRARRTHRS